MTTRKTKTAIPAGLKLPAADATASTGTRIAAPTLAEVRRMLRVDEDDENDRILVSLIETATERANLQAPTAPAAMGRMAIMQAVGWLYEMPTDYSANWWQRSGAETTLAPWTRRRAGRIGKAD